MWPSQHSLDVLIWQEVWAFHWPQGPPGSWALGRGADSLSIFTLEPSALKLFSEKHWALRNPSYALAQHLPCLLFQTSVKTFFFLFDLACHVFLLCHKFWIKNCTLQQWNDSWDLAPAHRKVLLVRYAGCTQLSLPRGLWRRRAFLPLLLMVRLRAQRTLNTAKGAQRVSI